MSHVGGEPKAVGGGSGSKSLTLILDELQHELSFHSNDFSAILNHAEKILTLHRQIQDTIAASSADVPDFVSNASHLRNLISALLIGAQFRPKLPPSESRQTSARGSRRDSWQSARSSLSVTKSDTESDCGTEYGSDVLAASEHQAAGFDTRKRIAGMGRRIRQSAIASLSSLNTRYPAQFFGQWPLLLSDSFEHGTSAPGPSHAAMHRTRSIIRVIQSDPVLSVRLSGCQLLQSMFEVAAARGYLRNGVFEQRSASFSLSFTSLSARIASLIVDVRASLLQILEASSGSALPIRARNEVPVPLPLTEAALKTTHALIMATAKARFVRSHADALREAVLRLSSHSDPTVALASFNVLSALSPTASDAKLGQKRATASARFEPSEEMVNNEGSAVVELLQRLGRADADNDTTIQTWQTLTSFSQRQSSAFAARQEEVVEIIGVHMRSKNQAVAEAATGFLLAFLATMRSSSVEADNAFLTGSQNLAQTGVESDSPVVRAEMLAAVTELYQLQLSKLSHGKPESLPQLSDYEEMISRLLPDREATVRAAAIRSIGVLALQERCPAKVIILGADCFRVVDGAKRPYLPSDAALLVRLRSSWTLGNLSQAVSDREDLQKAMNESDLSNLLKAAIHLARDDERIAINALRSIGLLLSISTFPLTSETASCSAALRLTMESAQTAKNPKLKWNAVNCLSTALISDNLQTWLSSSQHNSAEVPSVQEVALRLSSQLSSRVFKVKLASIQGLLKMQDFTSVDSVARNRIKQQVEEALAGIEVEVNDATFREAQLHGRAAKQGLEELAEHIKRLVHS